jgi:thiol-disulfide isomerase/thioredoxin
MSKPTSFKKWIMPIVALALFAGLAIAVLQKPKAPEVTFTTLDGKKISMNSLRGKTVLVNFWATDCPGCVKEIPALVETYKRYKDKNFEVIAVAMPYDPPAQVLNYTKEKALPFAVMHDGFGEMVAAFGKVDLVPTSYVYDPQGRRLQKVIGELDFNQLQKLIEQQGR